MVAKKPVASEAVAASGDAINFTPANVRRFGRTPVVVVEIVQPRCSLRFGVSPCTATGDQCFNCYWTCKDKDNYTPTGSITWRFTRPQDNVGWLYEETDSNNIKTNAIPLLLSASQTSSRLNPGASRTGESPLGRRATATIKFANGLWDDHVGDFYKDDRIQSTEAGFFSLLSARNPFYPDWTANIYNGYEGDTLAEMQKRTFDVEQISGPDGAGDYTITCRDPLDRLRGKNTQYPPVSDIELTNDETAGSTSIQVTCLAAELSANYGNTGSTRYVVIGDEIISYTGWTGTEPNLTLTGVTRGVLGTTAQDHSAGDVVQRGAYHVNQKPYEIALDILQNHTSLPAEYIDATQWTEEGTTYLNTLAATGFLAEPLAVEDVLGELGRDGLFSIWWDDRRQRIPLLAVRPPEGTPVRWTDDNNISKFAEETRIDERMTRVTVYYGIRNWLDPLDEVTNYKERRIRIEAEYETEQATGGKVVDNQIFSRWIQSDTNALLLQTGLLNRFKEPPKYLMVELDAKDRDVNLGDAVDIETRYILGPEGRKVLARWQVIGLDDVAAGSRIKAMLQSYAAVGKFAIIMANDAPTYAAATDEEKLTGCWIAENNGLMPDGSEPYLLQ